MVAAAPLPGCTPAALSFADVAALSVAMGWVAQ